MKQLISIAATLLLLNACETKKTNETANVYYDQSADLRYTGGVKMIPITTPKGTFNVWTKTVGNNPRIKLLMLHGGPGMTHECWECMDSYLPQEGIQYKPLEN